MLKKNKKTKSFLLAVILLVSACFSCGSAQGAVPVDLGVYTFYNESADCYLAYEGRQLVLSSTPSMWELRKANQGAFYVYALQSGLLLDIENAWVNEGTTIKLWELTGYDVQIWNIGKNTNGTYSITYSGDNRYCLGFANGNAVLQIRNHTNPMQEWKMVDVSSSFPKNYLFYQSSNGIVQLQMPLDILDVISEWRLQQWANELETAYYTFYELTNFMPYESIVVEAYKPSEYIGWVSDNSNIIHIDNTFIRQDLQKMAVRNSDWNFCALHEMGHMFDCLRPWNFESEMMTNLKLAYVLEKYGVAAAPSEFDASTIFYGADIKNAYEILGSSFSKKYDIFGCTKRFLDIKDDIGWEPFQQTFRYLQERAATYTYSSRQEKFEAFVELLSYYSGRNIRAYFSNGEWQTILNKLSE